MPHRRSPRRVLAPVLVSLAVAPMLGAVPAQGAARERSWDDVERTTSDPTSFVTIIGDHDEFITGGTQRLWRSDQTIEVGGSTDSTVVVRVGGDRWDSYKFLLSPPTGKTLTVGDYPVAGGLHGEVGRAGLAMSGQQRGCTQGDGAFTVHDIAPDLSRLWLTFEFTCKDAVATVRGEVRIDSPPTAPLTVAADALHWKASPPGRAYGTQPVFAVNTGEEPIVLGPAEVTGDAFSLASSSCGVLQPGNSCAIEVAFDPLTRGTEEGLLRVTTSAAAVPLVEVPLTGVGNVGVTHVYSRTVAPDGRTFDTAMSSDVEEFRAWANPRRVVIGFADPNYLDERPNGRVLYDYVSFTAAPGERLEAGRTYAGTCVEAAGAMLTLPGACHSAATGSFILDEFELRPDGTLARLRVRAHLNGVEGPLRTTTTVAWQATQDATPYAPFLELSGPPVLTRPGGVELTATFPIGHGIAAVGLYAVTPQGRVLVDLAPTHDDSRVGLRASVQEDTKLVAEATTGDGVVVTSEPFIVAVDGPAVPDADPGAPPVARTVSLTIRGAQKDGASDHRGSVRSVAELRLRPRATGQCLRLQVQRRVDGRWVPRALSRCRRTDRSGMATAVVAAKPGTTVRARAVWFGGQPGARVASPWRKVRRPL